MTQNKTRARLQLLALSQARSLASFDLPKITHTTFSKEFLLFTDSRPAVIKHATDELTLTLPRQIKQLNSPFSNLAQARLPRKCVRVQNEKFT